jgi:hypothetical protein
METIKASVSDMSVRTRTNLVKKIFTDVANPAGFASPTKVWKKAQTVIPSITLDQVKNILQSIESYTLHRYVRKVPKTRKYLSPGLNHYFQADLFVLNDGLAKINGYRYILFCLDAFSRKLFARPLKTKSGPEVAAALQAIIKENQSIPPLKIVTDKGTEFLNTHVQHLFKKYSIVHFTAENVYHAALVERVIRTLREKFGRYMTHNKTSIFIHKLPDFVSAYNRSTHSALPQSMSPAEVNSKNETRVWKHQFARYFRRAADYAGQKNLEIGQIVRITRYPGRFKKSTDTTFTGEKFIISQVLHTKPTTYKIASLSDSEPITGVFYRAELQPIT